MTRSKKYRMDKKNDNEKKKSHNDKDKKSQKDKDDNLFCQDKEIHKDNCKDDNLFYKEKDDKFNLFLNCIINKHLCQLLELIECLEKSLLFDKDNSINSPSIETINAAKNLFNQIALYLGISLYIANDENILIDLPIKSTTKAAHFGIYQYIDCSSRKIPFFVKKCKANDSTYITALLDNSLIYSKTLLNQLFKALSLLKDNFIEIKNYLTLAFIR